MSDTAGQPEDTVLLAGQYVLGVLEAAEMRAVAMRALTDTELAGEITIWQEQLAPLAVLAPPVSPPEDLWPRISRAIGMPLPSPGISPRRATPAVPLYRQPDAGALNLWRGATAASLAVAAALAMYVALPRAPQTVTVASLGPMSAEDAPAFFVRVLGDGSLRVAALSPRPLPDGRDLELWALPPGADRPTSLGVLSPNGATVKPSKLIVPGGKLLVSLEPRGGSPTGQPTGPVLYGGRITRL
jgi:anti-sigma-K factor RskA